MRAKKGLAEAPQVEDDDGAEERASDSDDPEDCVGYSPRFGWQFPASDRLHRLSRTPECRVRRDQSDSSIHELASPNTASGSTSFSETSAAPSHTRSTSFGEALGDHIGVAQHTMVHEASILYGRSPSGTNVRALMHKQTLACTTVRT